ncbi:cleavage polyadenylation factor subunit fip1 [Puccinia graminis f. sp. tritici]|uniref:Cleavage polyadenylation factor subunit fip1 n=1 Tax=Puccinia graminis f. sp. tritici TaxID=56615 RepID=A0A5B0SBD8_PUCGR|nr:cleavage polyadenylation factor subunit fip1 [Puccinia graminis f. sp. tritici]
MVDEGDEDEEEEEVGDEQGLLEDSDEKATPQLLLRHPHHVPQHNPCVLKLRKTQFLWVDQLNVTTEYKPLERVDLKLVDPASLLPLKPSPMPVAQPTPSPRHTPHHNSHNRLPTPENFPAPGTPPPQPPGELKPPDLQADNPVIPSGYDDKDGSALMNFDFDALPESEKGWKKPGAHLADWFNYGFDETTWRTYVMKQKRLRKEEGWAANPFVNKPGQDFLQN